MLSISVCLSVNVKHEIKCFWHIFKKYSGQVWNGSRDTWLVFVGDLDHRLDPGFLKVLLFFVRLGAIITFCHITSQWTLQVFCKTQKIRSSSSALINPGVWSGSHYSWSKSGSGGKWQLLWQRSVQSFVLCAHSYLRCPVCKQIYDRTIFYW